jgi:glycosyltransferase involved in cell wall biosynthesis
MALRKPVVTTPLGAQGIEGMNGKHFIIADGKDEMAEKILELLNDAEKWKATGQNAKVFIEERYTWDVIGERLLREIEEIV